MHPADLIREKTERLPPELQRQVLDFVEYLEARSRAEDEAWSRLSLTTALTGLEDEQWPPFRAEDFVEHWR
ncbi:MAG: DUF2281 domain-containing protein [Deferrisomatales bacterium]